REPTINTMTTATTAKLPTSGSISASNLKCHHRPTTNSRAQSSNYQCNLVRDDSTTKLRRDRDRTRGHGLGDPLPSGEEWGQCPWDRAVWSRSRARLLARRQPDNSRDLLRASALRAAGSTCSRVVARAGAEERYSSHEDHRWADDRSARRDGGGRHVEKRSRARTAARGTHAGAGDGKISGVSARRRCYCGSRSP